jgi:hypothetical protein
VTESNVGPLARMGPAARWCLVAGIASPLPARPTDREFEQETDVIIREGMAAVAVHALNGRPESQGTPYFASFRRVAFESEMRAMAADAAGSDVLAALEAEGVPVVVVKGPAAALFHPEGWPRPYADIDVLIPNERYLDGVAVAMRAGFDYSDRSVPQWRWFDRFCREGVNMHSPAGGNIDFHHHVPPWSLGSHLHVRGVIARSYRHALGWHSARFAAPGDLLVVAALHILNDLWKGKLGLASWRDVIAVTRMIGQPKARAAFERAELAWLFDVMAAELARSAPEAGIIGPATPLVLPRQAKLRLAALGWSNDSSASRHRLAWASRLPPLNSLAFLAGTAVPSAEYIRDRHGSYWLYWKRSMEESVSTFRGSDFRMTTVDDYASDVGPSATRGREDHAGLTGDR